LLELPVLASAALSEDIAAPKGFCGFATCGEFVAQSEVFKPFEEK
jgi:hypothetical protein